MTSVISRHTSTVSLISQNSVQLEAGLLVQCLNRYKEHLECGCEKVLDSKFSKKGLGSTFLNHPNSPLTDDTTANDSAGGTGLEHITTSVVRKLDAGARESLGQHLIQLLATIVLPDPPQSISEVDGRLVGGLPGIPDKLMPTDSDMDNYRILAEKGRKKVLNLPFDKIFAALKEFSGRFNFNVCVYIVAIAEHVIGNFLQAAICYEDKALTENVIRASTVEKLFILYRDRVKPRRLETSNLFPQDYDKCVDELCSFLHTCLEQINLLIRVFREPIVSLTPPSYEQQSMCCNGTNEDTIQVLFGNILDVYNNMRILLDTIEAEDEDNYSPNISTNSKNSILSTAEMVKSVNASTTGRPVTTTTTTDNSSLTSVNSLSETSGTLDSPSMKQFSDNGNINVGNTKGDSNKSSLCTLPPTPIFRSTSPTSQTVIDHRHQHHHRLNNREEGHLNNNHDDNNNNNNNNNGHANNNSNKKTPRRLVGVCLIELAEDDSLHAFSQYASIVLDSKSRDSAWSLIEHENYLQELCQLSRSIIHTASLNNKYAASHFASSLPTTDLHSFTCSRCQHWDTYVGKPRRRSTSSSITSPIHNDSNTSSNSFSKDTMSTSVDSADRIELSSRFSSQRPHRRRSPNSSSSSDMNTSLCAAHCNYLVNATRYLLPRLILLPIFHFFYFHELIETLHRCAYDDEDRARLKEVLSMLSKTRNTLERDLAKHPWVALHLVRLISTGQLTNRYRSLYLNAVTGTSCPPSPVNYTAPPSPVGPSNQFNSNSHASCASVFNANCNSTTGNIFNYQNPNHHSVTTANTPTVTMASTTGTTTASMVGGINSTELPFMYNNTIQSKADEIEKLLSSKDKLSLPNNCRSAFGDFVMESRVYLRTESKKASSEHIAYLFTGLLLICKWQERRSTPLNPNSTQQSVLRVKHRIPLDLIHVTDLPPIVQPNLTRYVGHSGPMTPSLVGAAVLAATSANSYSHNSTTSINSHEDTQSIGLSGLFTSSLNGSISSHSSLASAGGSGIGFFPFLFELEYVDSNSCSPTSHKSNHSNSRHHHHYGYHGCPPKYSGKMNFNDEMGSAPVSSDGSSLLPSLSSPSSSNSTSEKANFNNLLSSGINVNHIWIFLRTPEEKADWIASLLSIQAYRLFLRYIRTLPRLEVSLRLPSPNVYRFSQPDSVNNIIFETSNPTLIPCYQTEDHSRGGQVNVSQNYSQPAQYPRHHHHHQQQQQQQHQSKEMREQSSLLQSLDIANNFNSSEPNCFNELSNFVYPPDNSTSVSNVEEGEDVEEDEEVDVGAVELIEPHTLTSGTAFGIVPPSTDLTTSSSSQPSPVTTMSSSLSSAVDKPDGGSLSEIRGKIDNTNIILTKLSNSDSSSTLTLTSHGSNDSSNVNRTLMNNSYHSHSNTIKSQCDYQSSHPPPAPSPIQQHSFQSSNNLPENVNMPSNRHLSSTSNYPPQIRMATLDKLIERLTYPTYFDTRLVNCFLLVYRRVTTSGELLNLLIERFRIPDPEFSPEEWNIEPEYGQLESPAQHMLKRFRSGYKKRIQSRVIMFLSRWVRSARYYQNDFAPNPELRQKLLDFLSTIQARYLMSAVERIKQHLQYPPVSTHYPMTSSNDVTSTTTPLDTSGQNLETGDSVPVSPVDSNYSGKSCSVGSNISSTSTSRITLHNIHPYKLAEQVTLYEWELYRRIPFWEVESRDRTGDAVPNLNRSKSFSNRFRNWLVYSVLSESHPDDRICGIQRVIDLMLIMENMNNLQGSQEAKSALISAAVYRLRKSFQAIRRMRHYRETVDRLRREGVISPKSQRNSSSPASTSSSSLQTNSVTDHDVSGSHSNNIISNNVNSNNSNNNNNSGNTSGSGSSSSNNNPFSSFGLPFSTRASKSHERRIRVLEKQHASGELCHPCVPFIAAGVMTRLIHLDLRHPDTIVNNAGNVMINCWKHRQLAEIVERYLAFQRIPYTFSVDEEIREFLEHVDPLEMAGVSCEAEFERKMYQLSESYEPRESEPLSEPIIPEERRMTKEEIQAAQLLSNSSLKDRMTVPSVLQFTNLLNNTSYNNSNNHNNNNSKSSSLLSSSALLLTNPSRSSSASSNTNEHKNSLKKSGGHLSSSLIGIASETQERKYLRLPNPLSLSSNVTSSTIVSGAKHQHSMSDSHVISPAISPCHQATNSVIGVTTTTYSPGLSPPSTPQSINNCGHSPPPLPPRQRRQSCNCSKHVKASSSVSSSSVTSHRNPTPPPHSPNCTDACSCFPPPLPPKSTTSSNRPVTTTPVTPIHANHSRYSNDSSLHHSTCQSCTFNSEASKTHRSLPMETAPPLPPRMNTSNPASNSITEDIGGSSH